MLSYNHTKEHEQWHNEKQKWQKGSSLDVRLWMGIICEQFYHYRIITSVKDTHMDKDLLMAMGTSAHFLTANGNIWKAIRQQQFVFSA